MVKKEKCPNCGQKGIDYQGSTSITYRCGSRFNKNNDADNLTAGCVCINPGCPYNCKTCNGERSLWKEDLPNGNTIYVACPDCVEGDDDDYKEPEEVKGA